MCVCDYVDGSFCVYLSVCLCVCLCLSCFCVTESLCVCVFVCVCFSLCVVSGPYYVTVRLTGGQVDKLDDSLSSEVC